MSVPIERISFLKAANSGLVDSSNPRDSSLYSDASSRMRANFALRKETTSIRIGAHTFNAKEASCFPLLSISTSVHWVWLLTNLLRRAGVNAQRQTQPSKRATY